MKPTRFALAAAIVLASVHGAPGTAHAVNIPPTASCSDGNFRDGIDTRSAASYCANALNAWNYAPTVFRDAQASGPLSQLGTDAIFFHAGHAVVYEAGGQTTSLASTFSGPATSPTTNEYTVLFGDPLAAQITGPQTLCTDSGCRAVNVVGFPYNTEMAKFDLALFLSCESAGPTVDGFKSLARVAYDTAQVGTSIGFYDAVSFIAWKPNTNLAGDAFARRFWADAGNGVNYLTATINAVNAAGGATYGYSSYRYLHRADAPTRLGSGYYIPGGVA